jgi:hypothetical protein
MIRLAVDALIEHVALKFCLRHVIDHRARVILHAALCVNSLLTTSLRPSPQHHWTMQRLQYYSAYAADRPFAP